MSDQGITRRLSAIVSADVAGYSRLMGRDEEGTHTALKSLRAELIDPTVASRHGRIVKTMGDGMLIEFASAVDAVACCLEVQHDMSARNRSLPEDRQIRFRVGVNLGDILIDGDDIFGDGVNIAARLEAIAPPGGICISRAVSDQVRQKLELDLEDLGLRALKNIEEPVHAYRILRAGGAENAQASTGAEIESVDLTSAQRPSIAIMPFRNLNGDAENDFIADGIALGIQTLLVQLSGLFLINAVSDRGYRAGAKSAAEAVEGLPIRYVLEGTTQRAGQRVRVTVQLTDLEENTVSWAERYDRDLEDVFALQDDVTREVTSSLNVELYRQDLERILLSDLAGDGAWEYFLRGVSHIYKFNKDDNAKARQMFQTLYELRPDKVQGSGYLSLTYWLDATRGWAESPSQALEQARIWAEKALEYEENDGLGHVVMSFIRLHEGQYDEALDLCHRAAEFRGNCPAMLGQMANVQIYRGDAHGAVKSARESMAVRIVHPPMLLNLLATAYRDAGDIGHSIPAAKEAARLDGGYTDALATLCTDHALAGNDAEAERVAAEILTADPSFSIAQYATKHPYRDPTKLAQITEMLRAAGLPE